MPAETRGKAAGAGLGFAGVNGRDAKPKFVQSSLLPI
jgi:hypothetical protein